MTTTEPTDEEVRVHLAAVQVLREDFQRLWLGELRDKWVGVPEAAAWNAYRAGAARRDNCFRHIYPPSPHPIVEDS